MPVLEPIAARIDGEIVLRDLPVPALERLRIKLSLPNPKYVKLKRFVGFTGSEPPRIECLIEMPDGSAHVPRGATSIIKAQLERYDLRPRMSEDARARGTALPHVAAGVLTLRDYQQAGIDKLVAAGQGLIVLPCVAGETEISLNRGGKGFTITIAEAFERSRSAVAKRGSTERGWDPTIPTFIRSKVGDRIKLNQVQEFLFKGYRATISLLFGNGSQLRCTPEHEILTERGFVPANALHIGDRVYFDGKRARGPRKPKAVYRRLSWYESHPFARMQRDARGRPGWTLEEHRAVAEADLNGLDLEEYRDLCRDGDIGGLKFIDPKRFHVHHRDENYKNNTPSNLEILKASTHRQLHCPGYENFLVGSPELTELTRVKRGIIEPVFDVVCVGPSHNFCANSIVVHNCGCGKTKLGVGAVFVLGVTTLVLVHTEDLADQWLSEFTKHGLRAGLVGGGVDERDRDVVVAIIDSLLPLLEADPAWGRSFGFVIVDEAHHAPAVTFQRVLRLLPAYYRLGLTATPNREDGLSNLVEWSFGETLLERTTREMIKLGFLMPCRIEIVSTGFVFEYDGPEKKRLAELEKAIAACEARNALIVATVVREAALGETCLVLVRTREHAHALADLIQARGIEARALTGKTAKKKRKATLNDLRAGDLPVMIATSLADEGLDLPRLSVIALGSPQRAKGATLQRLGRLLRLWEGKKPVLYDFVDDEVDTLASRAASRRRVYLDCGLIQPAA